MIEIENDTSDPSAKTVLADSTTPQRSVMQAMRRGVSHACPACSKGKLYRAYLKVNDRCPDCREQLLHHRADDAPPYITIVIVGHIVVTGILLFEQAYAPPTWLHLSIWLPLLVALSLLILPRVKGALVGLQWALRMHGFDKNAPQPQFEDWGGHENLQP